MVDRTGKPVGESSSSAQIRTLFDEQRQMIIAECCEKVSHHELQAAGAEQERQILQEELWRQQKDFREVHQQSLTEMKELRKFQSSTFDTLARRKLIEDQNTIMELSGRLQELQNEVNCMNDSKDFQDAESVCSGNSHVTSQPGLFPKHPVFEGMLRPSFVSCVGCDIVQADHAPEAGVAQVIFHGILVRHQGRHQEEVEEELEEEVERRVEREHSSNQTQVRMHG